jgi:hypothetical protein
LEAELRTVIDDYQNSLLWSHCTTEQHFRWKEELEMRMRVGHRIILVYIFVDLLCKIK